VLLQGPDDLVDDGGELPSEVGVIVPRGMLPHLVKAPIQDRRPIGGHELVQGWPAHAITNMGRTCPSAIRQGPCKVLTVPA
jgi:hypothetical protein